MSDLKNKRIITAAVTGAWPKKENNPNVPMTPSEIADDVYAVWKAGAAPPTPWTPLPPPRPQCRRRYRPHICPATGSPDTAGTHGPLRPLSGWYP